MAERFIGYSAGFEFVGPSSDLGLDDIEVTPDMLAAGVVALHGADPLEDPDDLVTTVYRVMEAARRQGEGTL